MKLWDRLSRGSGTKRFNKITKVELSELGLVAFYPLAKDYHQVAPMGKRQLPSSQK